ncbi:MAG: hypothetical protein R2770_00835 [Acidimicrobiales bacterium]
MPTTDLTRPAEPPPGWIDHLAVRIVEDPLRVRHGHPISSEYVETFWLSHLGPSAICLLRLFDRTTRHQPDHQATIPIPELGTILGTPGGSGRNSTIWRRLDRLVRFGAARWDTVDQTRLSVWSHLDTVPRRLQQRWPDWLVEAHVQAISDRQAG